MALGLFSALDFVMNELALFAATGFLLLGIGDLAVDAIWLRLSARALAARSRGKSLPTLADLPPPNAPGLIAVFIAAWDEAAVIERMLRRTLGEFGAGSYRLYVGCYPNDPATAAAVARVQDPRITCVMGPRPGPTTKADCLNILWLRLLADEEADGRRVKAVLLHDAEDVVHAAELDLFDRLIEQHDLVQIPVVPLIDQKGRWIGGHYADEFAESHAKELVVRQHVGAAIPSAGVGCAFARDALERMAAKSGGLPFDAGSLTEDYELGLKIGAAGGGSAFVRIAAAPGEEPIATRELFPATMREAVAQKARWINGIALSGWDRLGWRGGVAERWMRLRDRQSLLAALLLAAGYVSFALWSLAELRQALGGWEPPPVSPLLATMLWANAWLLAWRLAMRFGFVTHAYGWQQGLLSLPRMIVGNWVAMGAAFHALGRYRRQLKGDAPLWAKTAHRFPAGA